MLAVVGKTVEAWLVPATYYNDPEYNMALAVNRAVVTLSLRGATYVSRPGVEAQLVGFVGRPGVRYAVVVGPRGSGKTTLIEACAMNHTGVIRVKMEHSVDVYSAIVKSLGAEFASAFATPDDTLLQRVFKLAATIRDEEWWRPTRFEIFRSGKSSLRDPWVPTIIVEVNAGSSGTAGGDSSSSSSAVARSVKSLNSDGGFTCRAIMVLSDAYAAFALPGDESRQTFVWIDDFSRDEADEFFDKHDFLPGRAAVGERKRNRLREKIFDGIGTRPVDLENARDTLGTEASEAKVDLFVAGVIAAARRKFELLFKRTVAPTGADFRGVVRDLLDAVDPSAGVSVSIYRAEIGTPDVVALALKRHHALLYHAPSDTYRFYSHAYYLAAKQLNAEGLLAASLDK